MVREPLYQRIERFVRDRWTTIGLLLILGVPVTVLLVVESIILRSWLSAAFAAYIGLSLITVSYCRKVVARRRGRAMRGLTSSVIGTPSRWPALDQARISYSIRTGLDAPVVAVIKQKADGTPMDLVDASLSYMGPVDPESRLSLFRSPFEAQVGDVVAISFNEPMLRSYDSDELLSVLLHLTERAALCSQATARITNGACEADSRVLLITHDHASLLRALEKCDLASSTVPPGYGIVRFSDLDLTARKRAGEHEAEWDSRDRLTELREHLMAAGLDVPSGGGT
jgi:hypothetical protein